MLMISMRQLPTFPKRGSGSWVRRQSGRLGQMPDRPGFTFFLHGECNLSSSAFRMERVTKRTPNSVCGIQRILPLDPENLPYYQSAAIPAKDAFRNGPQKRWRMQISKITIAE